jgi:basic membrane protein A
MSKKFSLLLAVLMVASFILAACQPAATPTTAAQPSEADCPKAEVLCIGLVTDVGEVDDKSFNQSAWEGVQAVGTELGGLTKFVETKDAKDYGSNIALFGDKGYDVIVTVGFALGEATVEAAQKYPNIKFIGVDQFQGDTVPNVSGLVFHEDQAGFQAGALAAQLTQSGTIAAVLGTDLVPPVVAYKEGYEAGARYINPDINIISTYHPGGLDVAFTDPEWGASTAKQAMDQGADVVFGAGGKTGNGALGEVAGQPGKYCIGVDTDQWETAPEAHPCLVSSAMKLIPPGISDLVKAANDGSFTGGNYFGPTGMAPYHDFDSKIPQAVKDKMDEIKNGLADGSITTGYGG